MKKRTLNILLVKLMVEESKEGILSAMRQANIATASWYDWTDLKVQSPGSTIPVQALVDLCNVLKVPIHKLFSVEGEPCVIPVLKELFLPGNVFRNNILDIEKFLGAFGAKSKTGKPIEEMMKMLGFSRTTYTGWKKQKRNLRFSHVMRVCEVFDYDLFEFIIDPNSSPVLDGTTEEAKPKKISITSEQEFKTVIKDMQKQNARLSLDNAELRREISRLGVQLSELTERVIGLESKMKYSSTGMIAEALPTYFADEQTKREPCSPDEELA